MRKAFDDLIWRIVVSVLMGLGAAYIRLVLRTVRWEWIGRDHFDEGVAARQPLVVGFWHGRIVMMPPVIEMTAVPLHVVISNSRDGDLTARLIGFFGGRAIRGSSRDPRKNKDKGGGVAMRQTVGSLRAGHMVALTPDGPRGPRMRAQIGVAAMSAMTGVPVIPFAWSTRRARVLRGWDRLMVPWPFDRGVYAVGPPVLPSGRDGASIERHRLAIEDGLNAVTRMADERVGRVPVDPAPPA